MDPQYPYQQGPYQQAPYPSSAPTSGTAIASLILSILGLVQVLPFIGSILGLALGYSARSEIDNSGGRIGGRGMATWGIILGWLGVAIIVLGICLVVLAFAGVLTIPALGICANSGNFNYSGQW